MTMMVAVGRSCRRRVRGNRAIGPAAADAAIVIRYAHDPTSLPSPHCRTYPSNWGCQCTQIQNPPMQRMEIVHRQWEMHST